MITAGKTVGVLGGMGPYATLAFLKAMLDVTNAKKDWDHVRTVIDNNPRIPSRTRHFLYDEVSPLEGMAESCRRLEKYPVDFIAIPCNSAAVFVPQLQNMVNIPILNICEIAANALIEIMPSARSVSVLGGYVTYKKQTYRPFLEPNGIEIVDHGPHIQQQVEALIERLKTGLAGSHEVSEVTEILQLLTINLGAEAVIFACTEFACLPAINNNMVLVDSSIELAKFAIKMANSNSQTCKHKK